SGGFLAGSPLAGSAAADVAPGPNSSTARSIPRRRTTHGTDGFIAGLLAGRSNTEAPLRREPFRAPMLHRAPRRRPGKRPGRRHTRRAVARRRWSSGQERSPAGLLLRLPRSPLRGPRFGLSPRRLGWPARGPWAVLHVARRHRCHAEGVVVLEVD